MFRCEKCNDFTTVDKNDYDTDGCCLKHDIYVDKEDVCVDECKNAIENYKLNKAYRKE